MLAFISINMHCFPITPQDLVLVFHVRTDLHVFYLCRQNSVSLVSLSHPPLLGREEWTKFEIQMLSPTSSSSWPELCLLLFLNHEPCVLLCSLSCSFWQFRSKTTVGIPFFFSLMPLLDFTCVVLCLSFKEKTREKWEDDYAFQWSQAEISFSSFFL